MTAKIDLIAKLTALMPECAREIIKIMREYDVQTAQVYDRSNLPRRVEAFLAAKRIDEWFIRCIVFRKRGGR